MAKAPLTKGLSDTHLSNNKKIAGAAAIIGVVLLFGGSMGYLIGHSQRTSGTTRAHSGLAQNQQAARGGLGLGGFGGRRVNGGDHRLTGVVTAVNNENFTLAGGGTTRTIKTNNNTTYSMGDKVSVNDTVMLTYTESDNVITAQRVIITNNIGQAGPDGADQTDMPQTEQ